MITDKKLLLFGFSIVVLLSLSKVTEGWLTEGLRKDLFNIYRHVAIEARDIKSQNVTADQVTFYLYTRENPNEYVKLEPDHLEKFKDKSVRVVFLIHGWTNSREVQWYEDVKNAFLHRQEEFYVIQVDWKEPANQIYTVSSINTYDVARIIAKVIEDLHKSYKMPIENVVLVGHSLGGQITGFVGKHIQKNLNTKLPRIIALDPAGPLFTQRPEDKRLNKNDAEIVHVVHSDGGTFGYKDPIGTIDFFPNGGSSQPGCKRIDLLDISSVTEPIMCDHRRAWDYFSEAVLNPTEFKAKKCESWEKFKENKCENVEVPMGDLTHNLTGNFYLETNKEKPYAKKPGEKGFGILKLLQH